MGVGLCALVVIVLSGQNSTLRVTLVSRDIGVGNHDRFQMEAAVSEVPAGGRKGAVSVGWGTGGLNSQLAVLLNVNWDESSFSPPPNPHPRPRFSHE